MTRSTIPNEDTLLAYDTQWSSAQQLINRCRDAGVKMHTGNKFELRIKGNSFTNYPFAYLENFIKEVYDLLNRKPSKTFQEAFEAQLHAKDKVVQIVVETRPDQITHEWCQQMLKWGVRTVEIGVQSLNESVLLANTRGHDVQCVRDASHLIRKYGFELGFQVMLGLYQSNQKLDAQMLTNDLWQECFYPDSLKVYPCLLLPDRQAQIPLYSLYDKKQWKPIEQRQYDEFLKSVLPFIPKDVHVNRWQRIFREDEVAYGPKRIINRRVEHKGLSQCMWQRSVQNSLIPHDNVDECQITTYRHGNEVCVQAVDSNDIIFGYARLRLDGQSAYIRDLRVLGNPLSVGQRPTAQQLDIQHQGVGKKMVKSMEQYAKQNGALNIVVNSSAGCVGYFRKLGYTNTTYYQLKKEL